MERRIRHPSGNIKRATMQTFSHLVRLHGVSRYEENGRKDECGGQKTARRALCGSDSSNRAGMFRAARMMLRSDSDAEEAVADATESAYAHLYTLRNWEAVRPWLMRITVNACHKMLRRRKRETPSGDETLFDRPIKPSDATEIWSLVEQLDALYSVPLTMFYADGMKLEEIAAALHVPKGTVSARMTRGRQKLKTWMEEEL